MAKIKQPKSKQISPVEDTEENGNKRGGGSIWPPTQRTRDAIMNRLIEILSSPSPLPKRYGVLPHDEASDAAKRIEEEAFTAACSSASDDDYGIKIVRIYSKEISRRMLHAAKSRSATSDNKPSILENKTCCRCF